LTDAGAPPYPIDSVDRALTVILAFEQADSFTIGEIGALLGVSRSTAYRLLKLLEHREFVRQDSRTKAFHGGPALLRVGLAAVSRSDLRMKLRPLLERIVSAVDETAHLVVLQREDAFYMDCVEGSKIVRATPRVGTSLPAHVTAAGKVLLAKLPQERLDAILAGELRALTDRSTTSPKALRDELDRVRRQGWALNDGESEVGLRAVAVPVDASTAQTGVDAAITIAGPAQRLDDARLQEVVATALDCLRRVDHDDSGTSANGPGEPA
jgi:IclR family transcriptional regulator, acetate operon repressor